MWRPADFIQIDHAGQLVHRGHPTARQRIDEGKAGGGITGRETRLQESQRRRPMLRRVSLERRQSPAPIQVPRIPVVLRATRRVEHAGEECVVGERDLLAPRADRIIVTASASECARW